MYKKAGVGRCTLTLNAHAYNNYKHTGIQKGAKGEILTK